MDIQAIAKALQSQEAQRSLGQLDLDVIQDQIIFPAPHSAHEGAQIFVEPDLVEEQVWVSWWGNEEELEEPISAKLSPVDIISAVEVMLCQDAEPEPEPDAGTQKKVELWLTASGKESRESVKRYLNGHCNAEIIDRILEDGWLEEAPEDIDGLMEPIRRCYHARVNSKCDTPASRARNHLSALALYVDLAEEDGDVRGLRKLEVELLCLATRFCQ